MLPDVGREVNSMPETDIMNKVLIRMRAYMDMKRISMAKVGRALHWDRSKTSRVMIGKNDMRLADYIAICDYLGVPVGFFIEEEMTI